MRNTRPGSLEILDFDSESCILVGSSWAHVTLYSSFSVTQHVSESTSNSGHLNISFLIGGDRLKQPPSLPGTANQI
jgi:hypothetical protein